MTKKITFILSLLYFSTISFSQGVYYEIDFGFYGGLKKDVLMKDIFIADRIPVEEVVGSYGNGKEYSISFGYIMENGIGYEIALSNFRGNDIISKTRYISHSIDFFRGAERKSVYRTTVSGRMNKIIPTVVYKINNPKINGRFKLGLIVAWGKVKYKNTYLSVLAHSTKGVLYGGTNLGLHTSVDMDMMKLKQKDIYIRIALNVIRYSPRKAMITQQGPYLSQVKTIEKEVEFVDDITQVNRGKPRQMLEMSHTFSNIGVTLGVRFGK